MKRPAMILTLSILALSLPRASHAQDLQSIPETAVADGNFTTLVAAVKAAGLMDTLAGRGPFTVLAPTDEAFSKLPEGTLESLLKPENHAKLVAILKLHVAAGKLTSDMAEPGGSFPTVSGASLAVDVRDEKIKVGTATVTSADIQCSNGVIHAIDSVLMPATAIDPKAIVGTWIYTKSVTNGEPKSGEALAGQSVDIRETSWTLNAEAQFVMDYTIDTTTSPNTIQFTITKSPFGAGMSTGGVIKMEGDELVVAYSARGGDAPNEFASEAGSGVHLFYLTKQTAKPEE